MSISCKANVEGESLLSLSDAFLNMKNIEIPPFQREYVWSADKIELFIDDFVPIVGKEETHFMGTIIYEKEGKSPSKILDGQQRIMTSLIAYSAAVNILEQKYVLEINQLITGLGEINQNKQIDLKLTLNNLTKGDSEICLNILSNNIDEWIDEGCNVGKFDSPVVRSFRNAYVVFRKKLMDKKPDEIISLIRCIFNQSQFIPKSAVCSNTVM